MTLELLHYAIACDAAYEEVWPEDPVLNARFHHVEKFQMGISVAYVGYTATRDDFLMVYRGTDQVRDVWRAAWAAKSGFRPAEMKKELELFDQIEVAFPELREAETHFTGHSWGGVLAQMHAFRFRPDFCVTFGCPSLGQPGVPYALHVVNGYDFVARLLPWKDQPGGKMQLPGWKVNFFWDHFASSYVKKLRKIK